MTSLFRTGIWGRRRDAARLIVVVAALVGLSGCLKKASWVRDEQGGYELTTRAASMDQAVIRFERTAKDLCGPGGHTLTPPSVIDRGVQIGFGYGGPYVTVRCSLTCQ